MKKEELGIVVIASNAYFILGLRLVRRFMHFYKGNMIVKFYFFSDVDPAQYLPSNINISYHNTQHKSWVDGTNSKFKSILELEKGCTSDYLYYFDADTNVIKDFTEKWFIGNLVGGEHYGNKSYLSDGKGFDRNPKGNSYVPEDSKKPYTYYYGAFFGGNTERMISMCKILREWQKEDQNRGYEPPVNDESYINKFFHYAVPTTVATKDFEFVVSDKGGIGDTRFTKLNVDQFDKLVKANKDSLWNIHSNQFEVEKYIFPEEETTESKIFKQTWWDSQLESKLDLFKSWIGTSDALSKKHVRKYIIEKGYKSLVDIGCGTATEYFAYQKEYPELKYLGVDSSVYLNNYNIKKGVPMLKCEAHDIPLDDNSVDVTFSRHVLEHQPHFSPILDEMIRIGRQAAIHVFFIRPWNRETLVSFDPKQGLYHNRYNREEINLYLNSIVKVHTYKWEDISEEESILIIDLKSN